MPLQSEEKKVVIIAAGLSPFAPDAVALRAGRMMIEEIDRHAAAGTSFAFETTRSGHTYVKRIPTWRSNGHTSKLIFLALHSPEEAIGRVTERVVQSGHNVAEEVVRRRLSAACETFSRSTAR